LTFDLRLFLDKSIQGFELINNDKPIMTFHES